MNIATGSLFIISAPSGSGKTSLVKGLINSGLALSLSISHTSRPPRPGEINGRDYHFVSATVFKQMQLQGEFLESAEVYGNMYGTSQKWINQAISSGKNILLEVDCQGAQQVRKMLPQSIGIFILPPSCDTLKKRLISRGKDEPEVIKKRLAAAQEEVGHINEFDYAIINDKLEDALSGLKSIIIAERLRISYQADKLHDLTRQFFS